MKPMMNPHLYQPTYKKVLSDRFGGGKYYRPLIGIPTRGIFQRASQALTYAQRVHARWCRLYDAAMVEKPEQEPVQ